MKHRRDTIGRNGWAPEGFKLPRCLMSYELCAVAFVA